MTLVLFVCPSCGAKVYASPNAEVGHVCRKRSRGQRPFTLFERRSDLLSEEDRSVGRRGVSAAREALQRAS